MTRLAKSDVLAIQTGIMGLLLFTSYAGIATGSTIEVTTYDPPMSFGSKVNGTKVMDYFGSEEASIVFVPWHNYTVMVDVSDYNECLTKVQADIDGGVDALTILTNNVTESQLVLSLPPDEQKAFAMDHCLTVIHIFNIMNKALGDAFMEMS